MNLHLPNIPSQLHCMVALAAKYGIADDLNREALVLSCSQEELRLLKEAVAQYDDELDLWLAGPEAAGPQYSDEYIVFSAMRMAADFA